MHLDAFGEESTHVAHYIAKFTIKFDANGGSGSMSNQAFRNGEAQNLSSNAFTRNCWEFTGWNTSADGSGRSYGNGVDGSGIMADLGRSAGATITLYAQWRYTAFNITVYKANKAVGGESPTGVGTLSIVNASTGTTVATESGGYLYFEGTAGVTYRIVCTMPNSKPSKLWSADGILENGNYILSYLFTPSQGNTLSKTFYFTKRGLHSISFTSDTEGCTAEVFDPPDPDDDGKYLDGSSLTIRSYGNNLTFGHYLDSANIAEYEPYSNIQNNEFVIQSINEDLVVSLHFKEKKRTISASAAVPSSAAFSETTVDGASSVEKGVSQTATLSATISDPSKYAFDGWYVSSGGVDRLISSSASVTVPTGGMYDPVDESDKSYFAKARVQVTLSVSYYNNAGVTDPEETCVVSPATQYATLGDPVSISATMGVVKTGEPGLWRFLSWFDASDTQFQTPLQYRQSETFFPTQNTSLVARVKSGITYNTLTVVPCKSDTSPVERIDDGSIITATSGYTGGWNSATHQYEFTYEDTQNVILTAEDAITIGVTPFTFDGFYDSDTGGNRLTGLTSLSLVLSSNRTIYARYGNNSVRTIGIGYGYAGGSVGDRSLGTIAITDTDDPSGTVAADGMSAEIHQRKTVTIVATPRSGYVFGGWFKQLEIIGDPYISDGRTILTVSSDVNLYAYFKKSTDAICEWEGSSDNKSLEWRSKTYVLARPANMNCCRVDTEGYPLVELDVDMFSSPSTDPTARVSITNLSSQDPRRIPVRRPERYLQICVKNDREVDGVVVGTNMTELSQ